MRFPMETLLFLLTAALSPLAGDGGGPGGLAAQEAPADSVFLDLSEWLGSTSLGHEAPTAPPRIALGLGRVGLPFAVEFPPPSGLDEPWFLPIGEGWTVHWVRQLEAEVALRAPRLVDRRARFEVGELPGDSVAYLPDLDPALPEIEPTEPTVADAPEGPPLLPGQTVLPGFVSEYADLGVRFRGRAELGGDWTRFRPCQFGAAFTCDPGLIPQLQPDFQFGMMVVGTVQDRVHINVDFDQTREFSATNNINIYYQGLADEVVQRVELGDVTFSLPESRFLSQGIPAGNFGFRASGQLGPVDFQAVWASQKGDLSSRDFKLAGAGRNQGFVQEDTLTLDDADFVKGQFFFLFHPTELIDYPSIDVLSLDPSAVSTAVLPSADPIQLYRFENDPVTRQQVEGYIQADAVAELDGDTVEEAGWFRLLRPGVDYFVHSSGLWIGLRSPLRSDEMLAVTYITATGDTIGDYNPERIHNEGERPLLRLLRASRPNHQPGRPTWETEMHQMYRVSGSNDVELNSVGLSISLGELSAGRTFKPGLTGEDVTFLKLFGLDEESPVDLLDRNFIYKPADESFEDQPAVNGTFIVFPALKPFTDPPPLLSLNLSAAEAKEVLGADANRIIYEVEDPFERNNGGLFRLTIPFRVRQQGVISSLSLGALGVRDGSERIFLGERQLERGVDYIIDNDLGQVTLLDATTLFSSAPDADIRAMWEQKAIFQLAPTSVFGLNAGYRFGQDGQINLVGLLQSEKALVRRPQLGVEPASIMLGGLSGKYNFDAPFVDRILDGVPGLRHAGGSRIRMNGEMAASSPDPNTQGDVYLDDFDATNQLPLSMQSLGWRLSSAPQFKDGAVEALPVLLNQTDVANLTWQHAWIIQSGVAGDSAGIFQGFLPRRIDSAVNIAGNQNLESVLAVGFGELDEVGIPFDRRRWRSITANLSATGLDLTKSEFLEFYVAQGDSLTLVIDLGTVSEDAMFVDSLFQPNGFKRDGTTPWGIGVLDQEADPTLGEIWSIETDKRGNWGEACIGDRGNLFPLGHPGANCTRGNGRRDSEDLDGDGILDTAERYMRYVVKLDGSSPFLARDTTETRTFFNFYRIPLRGPQAVNVGGLFSESDFRAIKHLRITVTGNRPGLATIARMKIIGSRWIKRTLEGVVEGLAGNRPGMGGQVEVTPVSVLTEGAAYTAPPTVLEQLDNPASAFTGQGIEFNEKSLGVRYRDLGPGDRVEVYSRFPQRPRNFLTYRKGLIWAVARNGDWGEGGPSSFFVKVGSDPENFYLYRVRLSGTASPDVVSGADWLELEIDFDEWLTLRADAEETLINDPPQPGDPPLLIWSADSTYAVALKDRARAPSLASVRELSMGVWNEGGVVTSGEVWVNEFRLSDAVRDAGTAKFVNVELQAADVLNARVSYSSQGALFRQLEGDPSYLDQTQLTLNSTLRLSRFAPSGWGVSLPLTITHTSAHQDPTFLRGSDVRADRLDGLRSTGSSRSQVSFGFRKITPSANPWIGLFVDGLDVRVGYTKASSSSITTENETRVLDTRMSYDRRLERRDFKALPGFLDGVARFLLPRFLEDDVIEGRFRWSPERLSLGNSYVNQENKAFRFDQIIEVVGDSAVRPVLSPREGLENNATIGFAPFESLTAGLTFASTRDLLSPEKAVRDSTLHPILAAERRTLAGVDIGWETNRRLQTQLDFRPSLVDWLRTDVSITTNYGSNRNASFVRRTVSGADTVQELQRNVTGRRDTRATFTLNPRSLVNQSFGPDEGREEGFMTRSARALGNWVSPLSVTIQNGVTSRFNREVISPDAGYQFGLGGPDDFRFVDGDTATTLTERHSVRAGSGVRLPASIRASVNYQKADGSTLDARSDRVAVNETWPDVSLSFTSVPLPAVARRLFTRVSVSTGYVVTRQENSLGSAGQQRRVREDRTIPLDVSLRWATSLTTSYRGNFQNGEGQDPTGGTNRQRTNHNLSVVSSFTPPGDFGKKLDRPVQLTLRYSYSKQFECRIAVGREDCVPFLDQLNRVLNLSLDTTLQDLELGLQLSYTDRQSFIGQRSGSTQFQLGFWGQFLFTGGSLTPPGG